MAIVNIPQKEETVNSTQKVIKKEKAIKGVAVMRKRPLTKRIAELFGVESGQNIFDYLIGDILIPAAKNTLSDFVSEGVDMALGIDTRRSRRNIRDRYGRVDYGSSYRNDKRDIRTYNQRDSKDRAPTSYEDILFETRFDASQVISSMCDIIETYDQVSIGDLFDAAGISGGDYTDRHWGWTNISSARIIPVRGGYMLDLPKPVLLK